MTFINNHDTILIIVRKNSFSYHIFGATLILSLILQPSTAHAGLKTFISGVFGGDKDESPNSQNAPILQNQSPRGAIITTDVITDGAALKAEVGPLGTDADISAYDPGNDTISIYVVKKGDTIKSVADLFDVSQNTILWANNLEKGQAVKEGDTLTILPVTGIVYTWKKGDSLNSVAKRFGADITDIGVFNGITSQTEIAIGTKIIIPDGEDQFVSPSKRIETNIAKKQTETKIARATKPYLRKFDSLFDLSGPKTGDVVVRSARGEKTWGFNAPEQSGYYINPVPGGVLTQGLHGFNSVDIGAPRGTLIRAAAAGTVIVVKTGGSNGGYGNYIVISHKNGTQTLYAHNTKNLVEVGDEVSQGQTIATVGTTGQASGPHVHFEVRGAKNPFANIPKNSKVAENI